MNVRYLAPAIQELEEAYQYYEEELTGLGDRFLDEVDSAIRRIKIFPRGYILLGKNTRRCLIKGFPHAILYTTEQDTIIILAISHTHRSPESYTKRFRQYD